MATFNSGGLSIAYDDITPADGANGTVLMVHGFATSRAENWRRLGWYGAFERKNYRIVALDLRGHGESEIGDRPFGPNAHALRDGSEIDVRLLDQCAHAPGLRVAIAPCRHPLDMHGFLMPRAVVMHDGQ